MLKKIVYFLLACEEKPSILFLKKNHFPFRENKGLPNWFIQKSKQVFEKNREGPANKESALFSWKTFCKNCSYEEVLSVVLCGVLKYPSEKVSWFLKVQPEDLSYRLTEGLLLLGDELSRTGGSFFFGEGQSEKKKIKKTLNPSEKKIKALQYCDWLAKRPFPDSLENMSFSAKPWKVLYLLLGLILILALGVWLLSFLFSPPSSVILYQSP